MRILHLSDIHFGIKNFKSMHHWAEKEGARPNSAKLAFLLHANVDPAPDVVVVSGDLGWSGSSNDYEYVLLFVGALRADPRWATIQFIVCPGNHDVDLGSEPEPRESRQDAYIDFLRKLYGDTFDKKYPLLQGTTNATLDRRARVVGLHRVSCLDGEELVVITANSAAELASDARSAPCPVDTERLDEALKRLGTSVKVKTPFRVFVVHHHLLPFYEVNWEAHDDRDTKRDFVDPSMVANSAKLQTWLAKNGFQVVLHGHKHIPHTRDDVLFRRDDPPRRLVAVGAGSAGVVSEQRKSEPLSFNVLDIWRLSHERWGVRIGARRFPDSLPDTPSETTHTIEIGPPPDRTPLMFWAEDLDDCHRAIQRTTVKDRTYRNFVSTVERFEVNSFTAPSTCSLTTEEVMRSFQALHPEHGIGGWANPDLHRAIDSLRTRFQFQHGIRLFNPPSSVSGLPPDKRAEYQPLRHAIGLVETDKSRAYVGLYDPAIDVTGERQPPTMTGIQFVSDGKHLDVVVTFRKIELSAWWVINMLEVGKLLAWAVTVDKNKRLMPGRITFFAALAEWKTDPRPTVIPRLDSIEIGTLTGLLTAANAKDAAALKGLAQMIDEKVKFTNVDNIDVTGVVQLGELLAGLTKSQAGVLPPVLCNHVVRAGESMKAALKLARDDQRDAELQKVKLSLTEAASVVRGLSGPSPG
jgi:hypothetical protein